MHNVNNSVFQTTSDKHTEKLSKLQPQALNISQGNIFQSGSVAATAFSTYITKQATFLIAVSH